MGPFIPLSLEDTDADSGLRDETGASADHSFIHSANTSWFLFCITACVDSDTELSETRFLPSGVHGLMGERARQPMADQGED